VSHKIGPLQICIGLSKFYSVASLLIGLRDVNVYSCIQKNFIIYSVIYQKGRAFWTELGYVASGVVQDYAG